tara:strand:- start:116265 stop:116753 length:489 start_codon:yes stop_codon:yes gene_type:complete
MDPELTKAATKAASGSDDGVTLVELLVVVAVLAVLAVGTSVLALRSGTDRAETDLALFRSSYDTARTLAIEGRSPQGLNVAAQGLARLRHGADGWHAPDSLRRWQGRVTLAMSGPPPPFDAPDIILLATGQTSAFSIVFDPGNAAPRRCQSDGWTGLTCSGD